MLVGRGGGVADYEENELRGILVTKLKPKPPSIEAGYRTFMDFTPGGAVACVTRVQRETCATAIISRHMSTHLRMQDLRPAELQKHVGGVVLVVHALCTPSAVGVKD